MEPLLYNDNIAPPVFLRTLPNCLPFSYSVGSVLLNDENNSYLKNSY